jgi:hypothetical protein
MLEVAADRPGEFGLVGFGYVEYSVVFQEGAEFLLFVGDSRWQGRHVPLYVRVGLLAAEGPAA